MTTAPDSDLLWGREELNLHSFVKGSKHSTAEIVILKSENIKMSFMNKLNQIKSNQIKSNQIKSNQIRSDQIMLLRSPTIHLPNSK